MQRFRRHLSYANVVATLALVVATAGGAYAVDQIGTRDVKNNSLRSVDLRNQKAVTGRDVRRNSLDGAAIRESRLDAGPLVRIGGTENAFCDPGEEATPCVTTEMRLPRSMIPLVTATGGFASEGSPASANCEIRIDNEERPVFLNPGEASQVNTSATAADGFASTYVPPDPLPRGNHSVELSCTQVGSADAVIQDPSIAVIAVAAP